jgi:RNase P subunit RPR2
VRRKRRPKAEAGEVAEELLEKAVSTAGRDLKLARVMLKFNVRLDWSRKRFYCHGCKRLIVPGVNARVRLAGGGQKVLRLTCLECGHVNRKVIVEERLP